MTSIGLMAYHFPISRNSIHKLTVFRFKRFVYSKCTSLQFHLCNPIRNAFHHSPTLSLISLIEKLLIHDKVQPIISQRTQTQWRIDGNSSYKVRVGKEYESLPSGQQIEWCVKYYTWKASYLKGPSLRRLWSKVKTAGGVENTDGFYFHYWCY